MAPVGESSPKQHGGWRPGAGRKKDILKRMVGRLKPASAAELLASVNPEKVLREIFAKDSLMLKQRALADLMGPARAERQRCGGGSGLDSRAACPPVR
jgi:hypothetical protein